MKHIYTVSQQSEISDAISSMAQTGDDFPMICTLLCEELLSHLVDAGYRNITVSARRFPHRCFEIRAKGAPDSLVADPSDDENRRIESEIRQGLLDQHANLLDFYYSRGVNRYRVFLDAPKDGELCDELYAFYQNAGPDAQRKPLSPLIWLVKLHPVRFALSMFVKALKHLGALMLPVFAANIIDTAITANSFFVWPVLSNILGSVVALLVNLICFWIDANIYHRFTRAVESAFKMALVRKLQALSLTFHSNTQTGKLLSKLISDVQFIEQLIYERLTDVLHLCVDIVFVIVTAWVRFKPMLLFYVIIVPAAVMFIRRATKPVLTSKANLRRHTESTNAAFKEMLDMDRLTRAQGM